MPARHRQTKICHKRVIYGTVSIPYIYYIWGLYGELSVSELIARFAWVALIDGRLEALAADSINLEWGPNEAPSAVAMSVIFVVLFSLYEFPFL